MTEKPVTELCVPEALATISSVHHHPSAPTLILIGTVPGKSDVYMGEYELLKYIHATYGLDVVFLLYDTPELQLVNASWDGSRNECNPFQQHRVFPDKQITADVVVSMLRQGLMSSVSAFGITAEPAVAVSVCDDWYAWVHARHALRQLDAKAGRWELVAALVRIFTPPEKGPELDALLALLRLQARDARPARCLELVQLLSGLEDSQDLAANSSQVLREQQDWALRYCEFYARRVETAIDKATSRINRNSYRRGAMLLDVAFAEKASELLRQLGISNICLTVSGVSDVELLDHSSQILGEAQETKLDSLFRQGKVRIHHTTVTRTDHRNRLKRLLGSREDPTSRIQALEDRAKDASRREAKDWDSAAERLVLEFCNSGDLGPLEQAIECAEMATALAPNRAATWRNRARALFFAGGRDTDAWESFRRAVQLEPLEPGHFLAWGQAHIDRAYRRTGGRITPAEEYQVATAMFRRAVYRRPGEGDAWFWLGVALFNQGLRSPACACMKKAQLLGYWQAEQYLRDLFWASDQGGLTPVGVWPPVLFVMQRLVLPLLHKPREAGAALLTMLSLGCPFLLTAAAAAWLQGAQESEGPAAHLVGLTAGLLLGFFGIVSGIVVLLFMLTLKDTAERWKRWKKVLAVTAAAVGLGVLAWGTGAGWLLPTVRCVVSDLAAAVGTALGAGLGFLLCFRSARRMMRQE